MLIFMLRLKYVTTCRYKKNGGDTVKMHLQESLYVQLKNAIRCHYNELTSRCGNDTIYGYSLMTDDCFSSIGPVANKERLIKVNTTIIDMGLLSGVSGTISECLMK